MKKVAVIGGGIAGLGCAHFLHPRYDLTVFEQNDYPGGHSNTITVDEAGRPVPIDTGFMVYNEVTYPLLTRLFKELAVETRPTDMSFSVRHESGFEFSGASFGRLFGQRRNLFSLRFWKMLLQIDRFNKEAVPALTDPRWQSHTVVEYIRERGYGDDLLHRFLVPMSSAVWSTPAGKMLDFPATTLLRFFHNHGFLGMDTQHPWRTLVGGSKAYVKKLIAPFHDRVRLNAKVARVTRSGGQVQVAGEGWTETFDKVVLACHGDQTRRLLADPTVDEQRLLGAFQYQPNVALLHTDISVMPRTRRCWASWNYEMQTEEQTAPAVHYWMNCLQGVSERENYFVSLNADGRVAPGKVLRRLEYEHPLFDLAAIAAQKEMPELNRISPEQTTYYCGSYFRYGFHEDAFASGVDCARAVTGEPLWT